MHTYVLLKNGKIMVLWSDNQKEETMDLYELSELKNFNPEWLTLKTVKYSEVEQSDTNLCVLNHNYYYTHYQNAPRNPYC